jgi:hypothetical protein
VIDSELLPFSGWKSLWITVRSGRPRVGIPWAFRPDGGEPPATAQVVIHSE